MAIIRSITGTSLGPTPITPPITHHGHHDHQTHQDHQRSTITHSHVVVFTSLRFDLTFHLTGGLQDVPIATTLRLFPPSVGSTTRRFLGAQRILCTSLTCSKESAEYLAQFVACSSREHSGQDCECIDGHQIQIGES